MEYLTGSSLIRELMKAAQAWNYQRFLSLIDPKKVNEPIKSGRTALIVFCTYSTDSRYRTLQKDAIPYEQQVEKVVDQLLAWGANIDAVDEDGYTALHMAVDGMKLVLLAHLLKRGANMRIAARLFSGFSNELTVIQNTCYRQSRTGGTRMSELLMLRGAKLEEFNGSTPHTKFFPNLDMINFYARIERTRKTTTCLLGVRNRSPLLKLVGKDIVHQIARTIYQTRGNKLWEQPVP